MPTPHRYNAFPGGTCCLMCFRLESDPIHDDPPTGTEPIIGVGPLAAQELLKEHALANKAAAESEALHAKELATLPKQTLFAMPAMPAPFTYTDPPLPAPVVRTVISTPFPPDHSLIVPVIDQPDLAGFEIFKPILPDDNDPGEIPEEFSEPNQDQANAGLHSLCSGHTCPDCKETWFHDYQCNSTSHGLCTPCATQAAVIINRPTEIEQMAQLSSQNISGQRRAEILNDHTSVVFNMIRDDKGELRSDWQEILHVHIRNIEQTIEEYRIKGLNAHKILIDESAKELTKLTPEERAQYIRDAAKAKRDKKAPTEPKEKKAKDPQEAYKKIMAGLFNDIKSRNPHKRDEEIQAIAEKQAKMMEED